MKIFFLCFISHLLFLSVLTANNYATPGTGVRWSFNDLVANAGGDVVGTSGNYQVNDTIFISLNDTLYIYNNAVVRFAENTYLDVNGVLLINPPDSVNFTKAELATGFYGMRLDSSNGSIIKKLVIEYGNSLRLFDCSPTIDSCIFRFNSATTAFGNAAISVFRSKAIIKNCQFISNQRAAIQGGSNIANAPQISNCIFRGNNTLNLNVPQINLGSTGTDTARILNNQILRASINSGGIGFLPSGTVYAIISGNTIKNNRYGLTFNGGSNINTIVSYNLVDSNNTQNDPNLGGSGISFVGGAAGSHQNSIVTGNLFRANLWGITIQNGSRPNLGNLSNIDTTDDGKNAFINNTNATTPFIDLYNNSAFDISAQGNFWGTNDLSAIESKIFHQPDNSALGVVNYSSYILPVQLSAFNATVVNKSVNLNWVTKSEINSKAFIIERSFDGSNFKALAELKAAGNSVISREYFFSDVNAFSTSTLLYYKLKQLDIDGRTTYSRVLTVKAANETTTRVKLFYQGNNRGSMWASLTVSSDQDLTIQKISSDGRILSNKIEKLKGGVNTFEIADDGAVGRSISFIKFSCFEFAEAKPIF